MSLHDVPTHDGDGISRRTLLRRGATGGLGLALAGQLDLLFGANAHAAGSQLGYGPLVPDPKGLLALPRGFHYEVVSEAGTTLLDTGQPSPSDPDGTAAFPRKDGKGTVLVRNHEVSGSEPFPVPHIDGFVYDPTAGGGTTTVVVEKNGRRVSETVSLAGTLNNCAGGRTPWETWLTCEETEGGATFAKRHGYVFEVDPYDQAANRDPKPIKALGRFAHESVSVDPDTGVIYQTEDAGNPNGLFYRWTPPASAGTLGTGVLRGLADDAGTLEALRATKAGVHVPDLSVATDPGTTYAVEWVAVPDRDATTVSVRKQAFAKPITRSRKLEGMWWGEGGTYFVASFARTTDGSATPHDGQVWFFDPAAQTVELKLRFAYTPADQDSDPDGPDNITVSPYGGVILAEDGDGKNHLVGSTLEGETFFLARNEDAANNEFAGPTFSRDGGTLFANVQDPGRTFAITGPFKSQR